MKYIIIGAGISGLSIGQLLSKDNQVILLEKESRSGGLVKCDTIDGSLFHRTGGHVFNTKRADVLDWFWSFFDQENEFSLANRNSSVVMGKEEMIPYPIENNIYLLDNTIGEKIINDFVNLASQKEYTPQNFEEFLEKQFGKTLYEIYFKPYNWKVWRRDLKQIPLSWLEGKLPMPSVTEMIYNNIYHIKEKQFVHSSFYYPKVGGSQFIADTLAKGLDIRYNTEVNNITYSNGKWNVNGETADRIVFCGNIKKLPSLLKNVDEISHFAKDISNLEFHGTTSVFCSIDSNPYSWIYQPSMDHLSHRIICTGNFALSNNRRGEMTGTIEFTDFISKEEILEQLKRMPYNPKYITHNYEKYTYPIQNHDTRNLISSIKKVLEPKELYFCGRFAEWEYANMDVCMGYALDLFNNKLNK